MNALTLTLIRLAFLAVLWLFVIAAVGVVRTDLFGSGVPPRRQARKQARQQRERPRPAAPAKPPRAQRAARSAPQRCWTVLPPSQAAIRVQDGSVDP